MPKHPTCYAICAAAAHGEVRKNMSEAEQVAQLKAEKRLKKTCYCRTCNRHYHYLGINRHRAMHRDNGEKCTITYTYGNTITFDWRPNKGLRPPTARRESHE